MKSKKKERKDLIKIIKLQFIGIGQPLNDNILKFNKEQMQWCQKVLDLINEI